MIVGIDPGTKVSAYALVNDQGEAVRYETLPNDDLAFGVTSNWMVAGTAPCTVIAIEMFARMNMMVGESTFETVRWIGKFEVQLAHRFAQLNADRYDVADRCPIPEIRLVKRTGIKMWFLGVPRGNDGEIRRVLCDRYGGTINEVKGTKKNKGPLYGIKAHEWQALAVARYVYEIDSTPVSPQLSSARP